MLLKSKDVCSILFEILVLLVVLFVKYEGLTFRPQMAYAISNALRHT